MAAILDIRAEHQVSAHFDIWLFDQFKMAAMAIWWPSSIHNRTSIANLNLHIAANFSHKVSIQYDTWLGNLCTLKRCYCGWTMTMDFAMDQCLQSGTRQSHSLDADWIVK